jgi:DNA-binding transcriptional ArsR family regulator
MHSPIFKIHPVRRQILLNLSRAESLKFNKIKDFDIDPRNFVYHLDKLKELKLVDYNENTAKYSLTDKAKRLLDNSGFKKGIINSPIDTFIGLAAKRKNKLLVVKRSKAPYLNHVGIPVFDTELDNLIKETAEKALKSLGLQGALNHILLIETIYKNNVNTSKSLAITHTNMHVFFVDNPDGQITEQNKEGKLHWMETEKLLKVEKGYQDTKTIINSISQYASNQNAIGNTADTKDRIKVISKIDSETEY